MPRRNNTASETSLALYHKLTVLLVGFFIVCFASSCTNTQNNSSQITAVNQDGDTLLIKIINYDETKGVRDPALVNVYLNGGNPVIEGLEIEPGENAVIDLDEFGVNWLSEEYENYISVKMVYSPIFIDGTVYLGIEEQSFRFEEGDHEIVFDLSHQDSMVLSKPLLEQMIDEQLFASDTVYQMYQRRQGQRISLGETLDEFEAATLARNELKVKQFSELGDDLQNTPEGDLEGLIEIYKALRTVDVLQ